MQTFFTEIIKYLPCFFKFLTLIMPFFLYSIHHYRRFKQQKTLPSWVIFLLAVFSFWLCVQFSVYFEELYLETQLNTFDLNGDDIFSDEEQTKGFSEIFNKVISDTARTFAPITGAIFGVVYAIITWFIGGFIRLVGLKIYDLVMYK